MTVLSKPANTAREVTATARFDVTRQLNNLGRLDQISWPAGTDRAAILGDANYQARRVLDFLNTCPPVPSLTLASNRRLHSVIADQLTHISGAISDTRAQMLAQPSQVRDQALSAVAEQVSQNLELISQRLFARDADHDSLVREAKKERDEKSIARENILLMCTPFFPESARSLLRAVTMPRAAAETELGKRVAAADVLPLARQASDGSFAASTVQNICSHILSLPFSELGATAVKQIGHVMSTVMDGGFQSNAARASFSADIARRGVEEISALLQRIRLHPEVTPDMRRAQLTLVAKELQRVRAIGSTLTNDQSYAGANSDLALRWLATLNTDLA